MLSRRWPRRACVALPAQQRRWKQERSSLAGLGLKSPTEVGMSPKVNASQGSQSVLEHLEWSKHESAKARQERDEKQQLLREMDENRQPSFYRPQEVEGAGGEDGEEVPESLFLITGFALILGWCTSMFSMFWVFFTVADFSRKNLGITVPPFGYGRSNQSKDAFSVTTSWFPMMVIPSMVVAVLARDIFRQVLVRQSNGLAQAYDSMVRVRVQGAQVGTRENHESGVNKLFTQPNNPHHDHRGLDMTHVAGIKNILTIEGRDQGRRGR